MMSYRGWGKAGHHEASSSSDVQTSGCSHASGYQASGSSQRSGFLTNRSSNEPVRPKVIVDSLHFVECDHNSEKGISLSDSVSHSSHSSKSDISPAFDQTGPQMDISPAANTQTFQVFSACADKETNEALKCNVPNGSGPNRCWDLRDESGQTKYPLVPNVSLLTEESSSRSDIKDELFQDKLGPAASSVKPEGAVKACVSMNKVCYREGSICSDKRPEKCYPSPNSMASVSNQPSHEKPTDRSAEQVRAVGWTNSSCGSELSELHSREPHKQNNCMDKPHSMGMGSPNLACQPVLAYSGKHHNAQSSRSTTRPTDIMPSKDTLASHSMVGQSKGRPNLLLSLMPSEGEASVVSTSSWLFHSHLDTSSSSGDAGRAQPAPCAVTIVETVGGYGQEPVACSPSGCPCVPEYLQAGSDDNVGSVSDTQLSEASGQQSVADHTIRPAQTFTGDSQSVVRQHLLAQSKTHALRSSEESSETSCVFDPTPFVASQHPTFPLVVSQTCSPPWSPGEKLTDVHHDSILATPGQQTGQLPMYVGQRPFSYIHPDHVVSSPAHLKPLTHTHDQKSLQSQQQDVPLDTQHMLNRHGFTSPPSQPHQYAVLSEETNSSPKLIRRKFLVPYPSLKIVHYVPEPEHPNSPTGSPSWQWPAHESTPQNSDCSAQLQEDHLMVCQPPYSPINFSGSGSGSATQCNAWMSNRPHHNLSQSPTEQLTSSPLTVREATYHVDKSPMLKQHSSVSPCSHAALVNNNQPTITGISELVTSFPQHSANVGSLEYAHVWKFPGTDQQQSYQKHKALSPEQIDISAGCRSPHASANFILAKDPSDCGCKASPLTSEGPSLPHPEPASPSLASWDRVSPTEYYSVRTGPSQGKEYSAHEAGPMLLGVGKPTQDLLCSHTTLGDGPCLSWASEAHCTQPHPALSPVPSLAHINILPHPQVAMPVAHTFHYLKQVAKTLAEEQLDSLISTVVDNKVASSSMALKSELKDFLSQEMKQQATNCPPAPSNQDHMTYLQKELWQGPGQKSSSRQWLGWFPTFVQSLPNIESLQYLMSEVMNDLVHSIMTEVKGLQDSDPPPSQRSPYSQASRQAHLAHPYSGHDKTLLIPEGEFRPPVQMNSSNIAESKFDPVVTSDSGCQLSDYQSIVDSYRQDCDKADASDTQQLACASLLSAWPSSPTQAQARSFKYHRRPTVPASIYQNIPQLRKEQVSSPSGKVKSVALEHTVQDWTQEQKYMPKHNTHLNNCPKARDWVLPRGPGAPMPPQEQICLNVLQLRNPWPQHHLDMSRKEQEFAPPVKAGHVFVRTKPAAPDSPYHYVDSKPPQGLAKTRSSHKQGLLIESLPSSARPQHCQSPDASEQNQLAHNSTQNEHVTERATSPTRAIAVHCVQARLDKQQQTYNCPVIQQNLSTVQQPHSAPAILAPTNKTVSKHSQCVTARQEVKALKSNSHCKSGHSGHDTGQCKMEPPDNIVKTDDSTVATVTSRLSSASSQSKSKTLATRVLARPSRSILSDPSQRSRSKYKSVGFTSRSQDRIIRPLYPRLNTSSFHCMTVVTAGDKGPPAPPCPNIGSDSEVTVSSGKLSSCMQESNDVLTSTECQSGPGYIVLTSSPVSTKELSKFKQNFMAYGASASGQQQKHRLTASSEVATSQCQKSVPQSPRDTQMKKSKGDHSSCLSQHAADSLSPRTNSNKPTITHTSSGKNEPVKDGKETSFLTIEAAETDYHSGCASPSPFNSTFLSELLHSRNISPCVSETLRQKRIQLLYPSLNKGIPFIQPVQSALQHRGQWFASMNSKRASSSILRPVPVKRRHVTPAASILHSQTKRRKLRISCDNRCYQPVQATQRGTARNWLSEGSVTSSYQPTRAFALRTPTSPQLSRGHSWSRFRTYSPPLTKLSDLLGSPKFAQHGHTSPGGTTMAASTPISSHTPIISHTPSASLTPIASHIPIPSHVPIPSYTSIPSHSPMAPHSPIPSNTPIPSHSPIAPHSPIPSHSPMAPHSPMASLTPSAISKRCMQSNSPVFPRNSIHVQSTNVQQLTSPLRLKLQLMPSSPQPYSFSSQASPSSCGKRERYLGSSSLKQENQQNPSGSMMKYHISVTNRADLSGKDRQIVIKKTTEIQSPLAAIVQSQMSQQKKVEQSCGCPGTSPVLVASPHTPGPSQSPSFRSPTGQMLRFVKTFLALKKWLTSKNKLLAKSGCSASPRSVSP